MGGAWQEYERSRESSSRAGALFAVVGVAAFAFLAFHHFYGRDLAAADPAVAPVATTPVVADDSVEQRDETPVPEPSGVIVAPGQRAYAADGTAYVGIFECTVKGQRVVSDRPCGAGATARVLEVAPATAAAPAIASYRPTQPSYGTSPARSAAGSATAVPDNASACAAVDQAIDNLNSRMRQQYGSAEGEWLRQEWHRLKQQRYDLRCGR
jgi:hypothetical protein